jgi:hypothetical protein
MPGMMVEPVVAAAALPLEELAAGAPVLVVVLVAATGTTGVDVTG